MTLIFKIIFTLLPTWVAASVAGLSYLDNLVERPLKPLPGEDPCNPLYWYPRPIPEKCYNKQVKPTPLPPPQAPPLPPLPPPLPPPPPNFPVIPMPPAPIPYPMPLFPSFPMYPMPQYPPMLPTQAHSCGTPNMPYPPSYPPPSNPPPSYPPPSHPPPSYPPPSYPPPSYPPPSYPPPSYPPPSYPSPSVPFIMPGAPTFVPQAAPEQFGFVPGIPGIVSPDGGINILPFSDAYSDMLEKHKQKYIRRRLAKVLDEYDTNYRKYI